MTDQESVESFRARARAFLADNIPRQTSRKIVLRAGASEEEELAEVQRDLRSQIRRYPLYFQTHLLKAFAQAGQWRYFWELLPRVSPLALLTRQWAHILGAALLGRLYWRLIPHVNSPGTRVRYLLARVRGAA